MPVYALFGATGSTGSATLRRLISHPPENLEFNIFVRSESKLLTAFPDLDRITPFKTTIVVGTPADTTATRACLQNADVVFACIGSNYSTPNISLITDTARAIISALEFHRNAQGPAYKTPTVIQLRSASLNPILNAQVPWIGQKLVFFVFGHLYADLERACKLFASAAETSPGLLEYIWVDPPALHDPDGVVPTGYELILEEDETQRPDLSYADLGVAFCEVAERRKELMGRAVGVTATGKVNQTMGTLLGYAAAGVKGRVWVWG
jgi:hypothetical protein